MKIYAASNLGYDSLQENGLIKYEKLTKQYLITEKGLRFLHAYDQIIELLSSKNKEMKITI
jgi:predicted transcriptional regulator